MVFLFSGFAEGYGRDFTDCGGQKVCLLVLLVER